EDKIVQKVLIPLQVALDIKPQPDVFLVGEILVRHIPRIAAVGHFADGVDAVERDDRTCRFLANVVVGYQALAGNDQALGGAGNVQVGDGGATDAAIAVAVGLVDVDGRDIGIESWHGRQVLTRERAVDRLGGAAQKSIGAYQRAAGQER